MGPRVLIVDDDAQIRRFLKYILVSADYEVAEASNGFEALAQAASQRPDAILLDVMMPELDGFETCRRLRNLPNMATVPIIILSAKDQVSDKVEGFKVGATDYLTKPVERAELLARLEAHLRVVGTVAEKPALERTLARLFIITGIKGGVGATTIATNLAFGLSRDTGQSVILADDDVPYGDAALALNLVAQHGLETLAQYQDSLDREVLEGVLTAHPSGLRVLAAAGTTHEAQHYDPDVILKVVPLLREMADYVVVDTPPLVEYPLPELIKAGTRVLLVTTPDIGALRRTVAALQWLEQMGKGTEEVLLLLNRAGRGAVPIAQVERHLGRGLDYVLEEDSRVRLSYNRGVPVLQDSPRSQAAKVLTQLSRALKDIPKPVVRG